MRQAANPGGSALRERLGQWFRVDPRPVPAARLLRTALRTAHLIAAGALYGGHVYGVEAERLVPALAGVLATGGAFLAIEVYQASVWLVQIRGVATLVKLALVAAVAVFWELRVLLLTLAVIVGGVSSHMPGRWRYHSVIHGRVVGSQESG
jgi:hypothetical protein